MSVLIAIPARYASTRYPGKPLVSLKGPDGEKTLIRRSWEAAMAVRGVDRVVVATDDLRIAEHAQAFGADVVMTSSAAQNGTERCAEVLQQLPGFDVVVNLQGDAPLTPAWFVEDLIAGLASDAEADLATPVLRCDGRAVAGFLADRRAGRVGGTTAVFGAGGRGMYFSKEVIPYTGKTYADDEPTPVFHHV
ncbi:MAG: 3-deoxy-manno-octulosonate cytidylyltransferase, partial [Paracoccaceae bacterium]